MRLGNLLGPIGGAPRARGLGDCWGCGRGMGALPADVGEAATRDDAWVTRITDLMVRRGQALVGAPRIPATGVLRANDDVRAWLDAAQNLREALNYAATQLSAHGLSPRVTANGWAALQETLNRQSWTFTSQLQLAGHRSVQRGGQFGTIDRTGSAPPANLTGGGGQTLVETPPGGGGGIVTPSTPTTPATPEGKDGPLPTSGDKPAGTTGGAADSILNVLWPADAAIYARPGLWLGIAVVAAGVGYVATRKPGRAAGGEGYRKNKVSWTQAQKAGQELALFKYGRN